MNKIAHFEIPSTNLAKSVAFYSKLFGWKMEPWGDEYTVFEVKDSIGGGIVQVKKAPGDGLMVYVTVNDIPTTLKKVVKLGGEVITPKTAIGDGMGFWAVFKDPGDCSGVGLFSKK
jgi:predicted enzyme related to lactoylglutathione lyase